MYIDILNPSKVSSMATNAERASYVECLQSIISLREEEFKADCTLLTIEFRNYHLGLEAAGDATFWSKVQTVVRKLMELLKAVASKITAYIQTVPGRIHNFVLRVSNWAAKLGLESKLKNQVETQNRRTIDPERAEAFKKIEFGPMNFDEILCGTNTANETQQAEANRMPGKGRKLIDGFLAIVSTIGQGFWGRFSETVKKKLAARTEVRVENAKTAGADTAARSGTATETLVNSHASADKIYTIKEFTEEDEKFRELLNLLEDAARAIGATKTFNDVPNLNTAWNMFRTVTNGNIERQANSVIQAIDRSKRLVDAMGRTLSAAFNQAYAAKDSEKVSAIREAMADCRYLYTLYIKMIVRVDTAAQRCTSNVISFVKEVMNCYKFDSAKAEEARVGTPKDSEERAKDANAAAAANNQGAQNNPTSDNVQDFSHIFDF